MRWSSRRGGQLFLDSRWTSCRNKRRLLRVTFSPRHQQHERQGYFYNAWNEPNVVLVWLKATTSVLLLAQSRTLPHLRRYRVPSVSEPCSAPSSLSLHTFFFGSALCKVHTEAAMDFPLRCNSLACRAPLSDRAVVTTCRYQYLALERGFH